MSHDFHGTTGGVHCGVYSAEEQAPSCYWAGASERSAHVYADRMFKNAAVRGEIERRLAVLLDRYEVSADRIIRELAKIAFANVDDFICKQDDGSLAVDFS